MRLLEYNNDGEFSLAEFFGDDIPQYTFAQMGSGGGNLQRSDEWYGQKQGWLRQNTVLRRTGSA
jgi:hypothetical protein